MPTYEYHCKGCGHRFDRFQGINEKPVRACPKCRKRKVERLIGSGSGFLFKGSGFYVTDYRSKGFADRARADTPPAPSGKDGAKPSAGAKKPKAKDA